MADASKGREFLQGKMDERPRTLSPIELREELLHVHRVGYGRGDRAGWSQVDRHFTVAPGQVTTITGYPNSGKSQFMDSLALNLARQGWRFCFCSLENIPIVLHVEKLIKQYIGKPVREGLSTRMSEDEMIEAAVDMADWFNFILPAEKKPNPSLHDVMEVIEQNFKQRELWGAKESKMAAVIDPWNELEHFRPRGMSLTEYIGESLSLLRQWSRQTRIHVFIIAHPAKQPRLRDSGKLPVPTPDMISDSAHFWNKSDNCISVALQDEHNSPAVDIHVQKIRFSHIGHRGMVTLNFDRISGRYHEQTGGTFAVIQGVG